MKVKNILIRYAIATVGLFFVALGVALSIKSNLGIAPISAPPYVMELWGGFTIRGHAITIGEYTIMMHILFIILQIVLLRKDFKLEHLMQIVAAFVFGYLTDLAIYIFEPVEVVSFGGKIGFMLASCLITALGISIEVRSKAWMLAAEMTTASIAKVSKAKFSNVKIIFDSSLVVIAAIMSYIFFGNALGSSSNSDIMANLMAEAPGVVIGIGTLVSAVGTGLLMKLTDPITEKCIGKTIDNTF